MEENNKKDSEIKINIQGNFCPQCGTKITKENIKFCPYCGYEFKEHYSELITNESLVSTVNEDKSSETGETTPPKKSGKNLILQEKNKKKIIIASIIVLIVIIAGILFKYYYDVTNSPDYKAQRFMDALKKGDFDSAYNYFDTTKLDGKIFLTKEDFKKSFGGNSISNYTMQKIDNTKNTSLSNNKGFNAEGKANQVYSYDVSISASGENRQIPLTLENKKDYNNKNGKWFVDPAPFIKTTSIVQPNNVSMKINDKAINIKNEEAIDMFLGYPFTVRFTNGDIKPIDINGKAGDSIQNVKIEPSDQLKEYINKLINGYRVAMNKVRDNRDMSNLLPYVLQNSSKWNDIVNNLYYNSYSGTSLVNIQVNNIQFSDDTFHNIYVDTTETWQYSYSTSNIHVNYTINKHDNGKWFIVANNN